MTIMLKNAVLKSTILSLQRTRQGLPWLPGVIINKRSSTSFLVQLTDDSVIRRHPDQLRHRSPDLPAVSEPPRDSSDDMLTWPEIPTSEQSAPRSSDCSERTVPRHSSRTRRPPNRYVPDT